MNSQDQLKTDILHTITVQKYSENWNVMAQHLAQEITLLMRNKKKSFIKKKLQNEPQSSVINLVNLI